MRMSFPRRGAIYWVSLDPTIGSEITKTHPALIISNDIGNQHATRVIVAAITSQNIERTYPFEVAVHQNEGGLDRDSKILLDQIRTIDKRRLGAFVGILPLDRMELVNQAIRISLSC